jgi:cyclopropane-fatty-acyl-phospholipid synthase
MSLLHAMIGLVERGLVPDALVRWGIRSLCRRRLAEQTRTGLPEASVDAFARLMRTGPLAPVPEKANEQHYEVPAEFFTMVLAEHLKYSSCYWPEGVNDLTEAEAAALAETVSRAGLEDGMRVLELGCGWGSLTLWMARHFPNATIRAVSNSASQREFIMGRAAERGLSNIEVITADMNDFQTEDRFDRIVSVEMFEHMRNYEILLRRVSEWLAPGGRVFIHIFCHRAYAYQFETEGAANWMGRHFFTGGIMPSLDVFSRFEDDLHVSEQWTWDGSHYQKTAEAWLRRLDDNRAEIRRIFAEVYGPGEATRWINRWRVFFMACAELFGYDGGREWLVGHYLLEPVINQTQRATEATAGPPREVKGAV